MTDRQQADLDRLVKSVDRLGNDLGKLSKDPEWKEWATEFIGVLDTLLARPGCEEMQVALEEKIAKIKAVTETKGAEDE